MPPKGSLSRQDEELLDEFVELYHSLPRIAARMYGLLFLSSARELSSQDLASQLGVSPASISTMGRLLIKLGWVKRRVCPETRRDLYSLDDDAWIMPFRNYERELTAMMSWEDRALATRDHHSANRDTLATLHDFHAFLIEEVPLIVQRYEEWRANGRATRQGQYSP